MSIHIVPDIEDINITLEPGIEKFGPSAVERYTGVSVDWYNLQDIYLGDYLNDMKYLMTIVNKLPSGTMVDLSRIALVLTMRHELTRDARWLLCKTFKLQRVPETCL